jgi:subtilisin-like proprotein convertase family protein/PKD repeat protein
MTRGNGRCETIMRLILRLAAGAAVLFTIGSISAPLAAAGTCTQIDNRIASRIAVAPRASTTVITTPSPDVPKTTVDGATVASHIVLTDAGTVRSVKIKDVTLSHTNLSDITLRLRAPDGSLVLLANALAGANMAGTTFSDAAPSIFVGLPPYSGTFAPQEWLAQLYGEPIAGDWQLEVTDGGSAAAGTLTGWTLEVTPEACGSQPVAALSASPNPAAPGATVTFDAGGSAPAPGATITHYEWDLDGNGTFETDGGASPTTSQVYDTKGTYPISVRVTDDQGNSDVRTIALAVTSRPHAAISITPSTPLSLVNASLDASGSYDPDGTIVRYEWDLDGDGTFETDATNIPTIQRLFGTSGPRTVSVLVTDDSGATAVASQDIVVQNRAPTADFSVQAAPAIAGATTVLDSGLSVDLDGTIVNHEWDFDNDGTYEAGSGGSPTIGHVFPASGTYTVGLRVTDNGGDTATTTHNVIATQAPVAAVSATPQITRPGTLVTFDPAGSFDPDVLGSVVSYGWDFDGNGTIDQTTLTGAPVTHSYATFGTFLARLTVTDDLGAKGSATVSIDVHNDAPVATLSISPTAVLTGQTVTFSAAGSLDPDGAIAKYEWDLDGNGSYEVNSGTTATITRTFPNRMAVTVRVRVTDSDGATAVASGPLTVSSPLTSPGGGSGAGAGAGGGSGSGAGAGAGPGSGSGSGDGAGAGGPGDPATGSFTASLSGASIQALRRAIQRGVGVRCHVDRKATCSLELVVQARDARRLKLAHGKRARRPVRIARGRAASAASGSQAVTLKLTPKARKALRRARRIVVIVQGTATDGAGGTASLRRAVMLR